MSISDAMTRSVHFIVIAVVFAITASPQIFDEYQVKAAFLYNFAKFVEWPPQTFNSDKEPIRICILGQDPFGHSLTDAVRGKTVLGRAFLITELSGASLAGECQVLFVSSSERNRLQSTFAVLRPTGVLTVGESEGFARQGGVVNFKLGGGRVHLEINIEAAERAKLRISSQVLSLAEIVKFKGEQRISK